MTMTMQFLEASDPQTCADSYRLEVSGNVCRIPGINAELAQNGNTPSLTQFQTPTA